jgi:hypothetical protein
MRSFPKTEGVEELHAGRFGGLSASAWDGWRVPPSGTASDFGVTDAKNIAWVDKRLGDQPLKTFTQPVKLSGKCRGR